MRDRFLLLLSLLLASQVVAQRELLQSGPMVGYAEMREVLLWVQTTEPATVTFEYWSKAQPDRIFRTPTARTTAATAHTVKLIADQVEPGQRYGYRLNINEQPVQLNYATEFQTLPLWQYRTDPPEFKIALGSCTYVNDTPYDRPGKPYGDAYQIFESIYRQQPDLMLWLGDNTYLREADWNTLTGIQHRYTHTRSLPQLQPLLANTHHYAIWDDHDFGPNDSDRSFVHKEKTRETFHHFWGNPTRGLEWRTPPGITTFFQWGDCDFFLLDNRYFRSPNDCKTCTPTILGPAQLDWLIEALAFSKATYKFVAIGGQVLNDAAVYENYAHHHAAERQRLLQRITAEAIEGVVFLSGDRHHTELSQVTVGNELELYDLTVSPLTSGSGRNRDEPNTNRVEGTLVAQRNFGIVTVSGPRKDRTLHVEIFDTEGQLLWEREIRRVRK